MNSAPWWRPFASMFPPPSFWRQRFQHFPENACWPSSNADYGIAGEGEPGILALLDVLKNGRFRVCSWFGTPARWGHRHQPVGTGPAGYGPHGGGPPVGNCAALSPGQRHIEPPNPARLPLPLLLLHLSRPSKQKQPPPPAGGCGGPNGEPATAGGEVCVHCGFGLHSSARHVTEICEALLRRNVKLAWASCVRAA